ncbi:MAG TPA: hypothetical protein VK364_11260, partial [Hymenobacter sp.]|nr:hypothetical protein [Hymenobacter sp.]
LERHRLRHGQYPEVLGALDPAIRPGGEKIPHDPATGRPPHYTLDYAGNYKLYFDGWNGTDDAGQRGWKNHRPTQADITQGDWLWPQPVE